MKKLCSRCGNELNLGNRFCPSCSAYNPFFIAGFNTTKVQQGNGELLVLEKRRVEMELAEQEKMQHELLNQAQLKKEQEEVEKKYRERQEAERQEKERVEREKAELTLKNELLRVKEETEQYKQETRELVKEVREELQHLDEENKKLQKEFSSIAQNRISEPSIASQEIIIDPEKSTVRRAFILLMLTVIAILTVGCFYFFSPDTKPAQAQSNPPVSISPEPAPAISKPTTSEPTSSLAVAKSPLHKPVADNDETAKAKVYGVSVARVEKDLLNKTLSGCGIVVRTKDDIYSISNLVLVDRIPSGLAKYKFKVTIVQHGETHTATPYIYYNADGSFSKIDGTNCE